MELVFNLNNVLQLFFGFYLHDKLVQMMNRIVRNRRHILNLVDMSNHGMDLHIRNFHIRLSRRSLTRRMGIADRCIVGLVLGTVRLLMGPVRVNRNAETNLKFSKNSIYFCFY